MSGALDELLSGAPEDELARLDDSYAPELLPLVVNASWMEMLREPVVVAVVLMGAGGRPNGGGGTIGDMGR